MSRKLLILVGFAVLLSCGIVECHQTDVMELTSANFEEYLRSNQFLYIKFFSAKCPFSKKMAPTWLELGSSLKSSTIKVAELECLRHKKLCEDHNVLSYPTIKMFKNGVDTGTFDTDKFAVTVENLKKFGESFVEQEEATDMTQSGSRSFGKCLGM